MTIEITSVKVTSVDIEMKDTEIKISGQYDLVSTKGKTIAKQSFNKYNDMSIDFDKRLGKDIISDIEQAIETEIGIHEAVKSMKGE